MVEPQVEDVALAEPVHDRPDDAEPRPQEVNPRLVEDRAHFAKEHINVAAPFLDDGVNAEGAEDAKEDRHEDEEPDKGADGVGEEVSHWASSMMTWLASLKSLSRTFRR